MKVEITFREYTSPTKDGAAGVEERGEFVGSFTHTFTGTDATHINRQIEEYIAGKKQSGCADLRVWHGQ
jgi:hypothetical protein